MKSNKVQKEKRIATLQLPTSPNQCFIKKSDYTLSQVYNTKLGADFHNSCSIKFSNNKHNKVYF